MGFFNMHDRLLPLDVHTHQMENASNFVALFQKINCCDGWPHRNERNWPNNMLDRI